MPLHRTEIMSEIQICELSDPKNVQIYKGQHVALHVGSNQTWAILDHKEYGEMLFIDDRHQSSRSDEHIYHESFVHSLMCGIPNPKTVLVLGGAEGCTAREVLRWKSVEKVVQVDWDAELCYWFRVHGAAWHKGAYEDARLYTVHEDALEWLKKYIGSFDAIFVDLFDPTEFDLPFFKEVLRLCRPKLTCKGGLAVNIGAVPKEATELVRELVTTMQNEYSVARFQLIATHVNVPSFLGEWCFLVAAPKCWASVIHDCSLPEGLLYFNKDRLIEMVSWTADAPEVLRNFWRYDPAVNPAEKLATRQLKTEEYTGILEHYGC